MRRPVLLGEFEAVVLLAVLRLGDNAYGVTILREIQRQAARAVSRGAVYVTLDRLERKKLVASRLADPTPERGGRAKRYFRVQPAGVAALRDARRALARLWKGLEPVLGKL
jgi:DNA-binding PadR family transcriptional regulator